MTSLTIISHAAPTQRQNAERQPTQDFADMLARDRPATEDTRQAQEKTGSAQAAHVGAAPALTSESPSPEGWGADSKPFSGCVMADERVLPVVAVSPVGITEALLGSRVFSAHLLAAPYLSEVSVRDAPVGRVGTACPVLENEMPAMVSLSYGVVAPEILVEENHPFPMSTVAIVTSEIDVDPETQSSTEAVPPPSVTQACDASEIVWFERILRITGVGDGRAIAWVRDYRLDNHDEEKLVQAVLQEARTHGVLLGKIIVNGREAWTSHETI